jgi:uncharacterized membrane protein
VTKLPPARPDDSEALPPLDGEPPATRDDDADPTVPPGPLQEPPTSDGELLVESDGPVASLAPVAPDLRRSDTTPELPLLSHLLSGLGLLAGEGASVGLGMWSWRAGMERLTLYAASNDIARSGRRYLIASMALGALIALGIGAGVWLRWRRREGAVLVHRLARRVAPLLLIGLLPGLLDWRLWAGHELTMLVWIAIFALSLQALARVAFATDPVLDEVLPRRLARVVAAGRRLRTRGRQALAGARWLPWTIVWLAVLGYAVHFAYHTIQTHYRLGTASLDLGLENNLVWNAAHGARLFKTSPLGGPESVHTGFHQTFFAYLLVPFYALSPRPQTLLAIQAAMIALGAVPLFLLARRRLGAGIACVLALGYLFYPPLETANLYDFHYQPLAVVFLFAALYSLEQRRDLLAVLTILIAFSVREDVSALVAVIGLYLVLTGERPRAGLVVMVTGALVFGIQKFLIMPRFLNGTQAFIHQYKDLLGRDEVGFGGVLKTVLANPFFTMTSLLERDKLVYLLQIFAPLAFLPWRRPIGLLCCVPGFLFTLLATQYPPMIQISFQYTAYWTPFLFIASIAALDRLRVNERANLIGPAHRHAWVVALVGAMLVSNFQFGAVLDKHNTRGGFGPYRFGLVDEDNVRHANAYALIAKVPPRAKIVASEMIVPHVSSRPDAYTLRAGIYDAEYLLFEFAIGGDERPHALEVLRDRSLGIVDVRGQFVLAKRGHATNRNAEVLAQL